MARKTLYAPIRHSNPAINAVFLVDETDAADDPHVMQYLAVKLGDQLLPFTGIRVKSIAEAIAMCQAELAVQPGDWQQLDGPPDFHAVCKASIDESINKFIESGGMADGPGDGE